MRMSCSIMQRTTLNVEHQLCLILLRIGLTSIFGFITALCIKLVPIHYWCYYQCCYHWYIRWWIQSMMNTMLLPLIQPNLFQRIISSITWQWIITYITLNIIISVAATDRGSAFTTAYYVLALFPANWVITIISYDNADREFVWWVLKRDGVTSPS